MQNISPNAGAIGAPLYKAAAATGNLAEEPKDAEIAAGEYSVGINLQGGEVTILVESQGAMGVSDEVTIELSGTEEFTVVTTPTADGAIPMNSFTNGQVVQWTSTNKLGWLRIKNDGTAAIKVYYKQILP